MSKFDPRGPRLAEVGGPAMLNPDPKFSGRGLCKHGDFQDMCDSCMAEGRRMRVQRVQAMSFADLLWREKGIAAFTESLTAQERSVYLDILKRAPDDSSGSRLCVGHHIPAEDCDRCQGLVVEQAKSAGVRFNEQVIRLLEANGNDIESDAFKIEAQKIWRVYIDGLLKLHRTVFPAREVM